MKKPTLAMLGAAMLLVAVPVLADTVPTHAPGDQYDPFDKNAKSIYDRKTKLTWERTATKNVEFAALQAQCSLSTTVSGARLPTVKELLTIVDEEPHFEYEGGNQVKLIDGNAFPDTPVDKAYWSQTPADGGNTSVWGVDFKTGLLVRLSVSAGTSAHVRCVK